MRIHFITDSGSDIAHNYREDLTVLPLLVAFGEKIYQDGVDLSHKKFYEKLVECDTLPTTSQVSPAAFEELYCKIKQVGDVGIVITISSKLSGTYQSACIAAEDYQGTIFVVDSENVTLGEHVLVEYALRLKDAGMDAATIVETLNREKQYIRMVGLLDTLEYLKRGGRVSSAVAFAGGLLSIRPVVGVEHGEVVMLGKARGSKQGNNLLSQQVEKSGGVDFERPYFLGYTGLSDALLQKYIEDSGALWRGYIDHLEGYTIGGAIGTHVGPGAIAAAFFALDRQ